MTKRFKVGLICVAVLIVATSTLYVAWHMSTPLQYQLDISNDSNETVDAVSVFGMGVYHTQYIKRLAPGQVASLLLDLRQEGDIRFSVEQSGNKIDHLISRDVSQIKHYKQWLTVSEGNRFIISNSD